MRRPREPQIFSLSALDVLAMATGVFVLILVMLMPYYRRTFDANAELDGVRAASAAMVAEADELQRVAARDLAAVAQSRAAAERLRRQAAALGSSAAARMSEAEAAAQTAAADLRRVEEMRATVEKRVIEELDLVFVVDTSVSMGPALEEITYSMRGIVRILERLVPAVRIGFVAYRDRDTGLPPLITLWLTPTDTALEQVIRFVENLEISPRPSPTTEEDLYLGLVKALSMPLRASAKQAIVVIGDAAAHPHEQARALARATQFAHGGERRNISALFVTTPGSLRRGNIDREFFVALAQAGEGEFTDHAGRMIEDVLLSVLID
jgi:hypothetical protein